MGFNEAAPPQHRLGLGHAVDSPPRDRETSAATSCPVSRSVRANAYASTSEEQSVLLIQKEHPDRIAPAD